MRKTLHVFVVFTAKLADELSKRFNVTVGHSDKCPGLVLLELERSEVYDFIGGCLSPLVLELKIPTIVMVVGIVIPDDENFPDCSDHTKRVYDCAWERLLETHPEFLNEADVDGFASSVFAAAQAYEIETAVSESRGQTLH